MFTDNSDGGSSFDLTSIIDTALTAAGGAYAASQATSQPTYLPGQNRYGTAVALGSGVGTSNNTLLLVVLALVGIFAFITFGRK